MKKVMALSREMVEKSPWTNGHSHRVMEYALAVGRELGLSQKDLESLRLAALLHDIGKINSCAHLLEKKGRLTPEEFEQVKQHPVKGAEIIEKSGRIKFIAPVIKHHHEHFDGTGYPSMLKGEEIPFLSRILFVADAFDSMTADRPYRKAPGRTYAVRELIRCAGTQFDPDVVRAFLNIVDQLSESHHIKFAAQDRLTAPRF